MSTGNNKGIDVDSVQINPRHWQALGAELWKRSILPARHPSFVFFFIVAIVGIGPTGVWIELIDYARKCFADASPLRSSFLSFVPAFLAATCMQLIWAEDHRRSLRAFSILVFAVCVVGLLFCYHATVDKYAVAVGFFLSVLAMWMWWIANANQKEFMDDKSNGFTNPLGGDNVGAPLAGNLDGFNTD